MARRYPLVLGNNHLAGFVTNVKAGHFATQTLWHKRKLDLLAQVDLIKFKESAKNLFIGHAECTQ